ADDVEALAVRRARDDRSPLVELAELAVRHEPERARDLRTQRTVAGDDEVHPARRLDELEDPLLAREPSREEHLRPRGRLADERRDLDAVRDHAHVLNAEPAHDFGEGVR